MTDAARIDILLATWNGQRYLAEQIDSILTQTFTDWRLLIRDDGSTDGTPDIIKRYVSENPDRIAVIENSERGLGARGNFARLMEHSTADYVMFSDQDDVWLPHKAERLMKTMEALEGRHDRDTPILVHSDLKVVGPDLREVHPSFIAHQKLNPGFGRSLNRMLVQNVVTGCASMCNGRLLKMSLPVPEQAFMHDWWLALVAAALGRIEFIAEPMVLYRQHDSNTMGAKTSGGLMALGRVMATPRAARGTFRSTLRQAEALLARHGPDMGEPHRALVQSYVELQDRNFLRRRLALLRHRFLGAALSHKLSFLFFI